MTAREWIEKRYGKRPTTFSPEQAAARVKNLNGLATRARKLCVDDLVYDARLEIAEQLWTVITKRRRTRKRQDDL